MNFLKDEQKSWTTRQSDVNPNSIIQNNFLEGLFRDILSDVHEDTLQNLRKKLPPLNQFERGQKLFIERLFEVTSDVSLEKMMNNMNNYFLRKSPSFANGEINQALELKYSNTSMDNLVFRPTELLFVDTKISVDSQKIEKMPNKMKEMLTSLQRKNQESCPIAEKFKNYKEQHINFIVVYFGYYNFDLVKNTHFEDQSLTLFGRQYKLRINAIFVSKVALMDTFRTICKVPNLEEIDQLLIQLYELKREKSKAKKKKQIESSLSKSRKKAKENKESSPLRESKSNKSIGLKAFIGITAVGVAVAIGKIFA